MRRKKFLKIAILLIIILLAVWWVYAKFFHKEPPQYSTAAVKRGDIEVNVLATGLVTPHSLVAVGARASGQIISMKVKPGDRVKQGELLAEIDPTTQKNELLNKKASLNSIRAQLKQQQAQLNLARKTLARQENLKKTHAISDSDYESAVAKVEVGEAQVTQFEAQITQVEADLKTAEENLSYTKVIAPSDGTVLAVVVQKGQTVNAVQSAPTLVILGDLSSMTVRTGISEADIIHVKPGQEVQFNVLGSPERVYQSTLKRVDPAPASIRNDIDINPLSTSFGNNSAVYYNGVFDVDNADGALRTYMTAQVRIVLNKAKDVLLIPFQSVAQTLGDNKAVVRVLDAHGQLRNQQVVLGLNNKVVVQVVSGLKEGDVVVTGEVTPEAPVHLSHDM
ncbi:efflux RND transporter periplasmic adaptor subunit [Bartonella sp. DGB2]|uniref:efflux RND transporter periplasmic adaptor subunit n=1 Tax=Bartonella sp. DGB2 TaxID=3388426 RepID=UPI00399023D9